MEARTRHPALGRFAVIALLAAAAPAAHAEWPVNGNPVSKQPLPQESPSIVPDGHGGAFVAWDWYWVYLQRFSADGQYAVGWPDAGLSKARVDSDHLIVDIDPKLVPDGSGGVFDVWHVASEDCYYGCGRDPGSMRVAHYDASGALAPDWPDPAVQVAADWIPGSERPLVAANGLDGVLVSWGSIRTQSIGPHGELRWGANGVAVCDGGWQRTPAQLVGDGHGGAYEAWGDRRGAPTLFAQHLSATGEPLLEPNGSRLSSDTYEFAPGSPAVVEDGSNGAVIVWSGRRGAHYQLYATRLNRGGGTPWPHDVQVAPGPGDELGMRAVSVPGGDVVVVWRDGRRFADGDIFAQRLGHNGRPLWGAGGVRVCGALYPRGEVTVASDDRGGVYVAWIDARPASEVYATHLDTDGAVTAGWPADGAPLSERISNHECLYPAPSHAETIALESTGDGRAIAVWNAFRVPTQVPCGSYLYTFAMKLTPAGPASAGEPQGRAGLPPGPSPGPSAPTPATLSVTAVGLVPGAVDISYQLPEAAPARLELFDVSGRKRVSTPVRAGDGDAHLRLGGDPPLAAGVYFARIVQGQHVARTRVVVLE